jgi:hypothetical protein
MVVMNDAIPQSKGSVTFPRPYDLLKRIEPVTTSLDGSENSLARSGDMALVTKTSGGKLYVVWQ